MSKCIVTYNYVICYFCYNYASISCHHFYFLLHIYTVMLSYVVLRRVKREKKRKITERKQSQVIITSKTLLTYWQLSSYLSVGKKKKKRQKSENVMFIRELQSKTPVSVCSPQLFSFEKSGVASKWSSEGL